MSKEEKDNIINEILVTLRYFELDPYYDPWLKKQLSYMKLADLETLVDLVESIKENAEATADDSYEEGMSLGYDQGKDESFDEGFKSGVAHSRGVYH